MHQLWSSSLFVSLFSFCLAACGGSDGSTASGGGGSAGGPADDGGPSAATSESPPDPCPGGGLEVGDHVLSLSHAGVDYGYTVHVPPSYDGTERTPLVLNWHGLTSNADQQIFFSNMNPAADDRGVIVVYPNSPDNSWNAGTCCAFNAPDRDDVGFALALVDEMKAQTCIDERRIYVTGMSNGGFMSHRLACEQAEVFAAVAPVAGGMGLPSCTPSRPVPIMQFHGTADTLVVYDGGGLTGGTSIPDQLAAWADRDGCKSGPDVYFSQADASCQQWTDCDGGAEVRLCTFEGEGHCWPGQSVCPFGAATTTMNASEQALDFFALFSL